MERFLLPPPLPPQGTIGIIAPGGPTEERPLRKGIRSIKSAGFRVRRAGNLRSTTGFTAGDREERLRATVRVIRDPEVDAVFCARGGQGSIHLVSSLVRELEDASPKRIAGYSDLTVLQMALLSRLGWVTFSGPMVETEFGKDRLTEAAKRQFWSLLSWAPGDGSETIEPVRGGTVWREGDASGPLIGGCLSMLRTLLGTPYFPDPNGCVLLIEDVDEAPYRLDRMLYQLRLAGVFDQVAGLALGRFSDCFPPDRSNEVDLRKLVLDATRGIDVPIVAEVPYGHGTSEFRTVPFGAPVRLRSDPPELIPELDRMGCR